MFLYYPTRVVFWVNHLQSILSMWALPFSLVGLPIFTKLDNRQLSFPLWGPLSIISLPCIISRLWILFSCYGEKYIRQWIRDSITFLKEENMCFLDNCEPGRLGIISRMYVYDFQATTLPVSYYEKLNMILSLFKSQNLSQNNVPGC